MGRMQKQGNKTPKNKPGLRLNLVLLKLVFKWHAETWFKLSLAKLSLDKLGLFKTGLNRFKLSFRGKSNTFMHFFQHHKPSFSNVVLM